MAVARAPLVTAQDAGAGGGRPAAESTVRDTTRRAGTEASAADSAGGARRGADTAVASAHDGGGGRGMDLVTAAAREYQRTGIARIVEEGAFVTVPYGHAQPTVTCAPLRACVIELEAGEAVLSKIAGDTQRWEIQLAPAGADGRTPLVVVKPHDCGLTTNLVLATTAGRIYDLTLDSPPCPRSGMNPHGVYVRHVRFYYPDAMVQAWSAPAPIARAGPPNLETLNFAYRVTRDRHFPWAPAAVFDDGGHCFIKLPPRAAHREAAVLFVLGEDGAKTLLNYNLAGDTYVTDRVFRRALLVVGEGDRERTLRLENLRYDAPSGGDGASDQRSPAPEGGDQ
jgi:P-type conjugative transfer protein TrbG